RARFRSSLSMGPAYPFSSNVQFSPVRFARSCRAKKRTSDGSSLSASPRCTQLSTRRTSICQSSYRFSPIAARSCASSSSESRYGRLRRISSCLFRRCSPSCRGTLPTRFQKAFVFERLSEHTSQNDGLRLTKPSAPCLQTGDQILVEWKLPERTDSLLDH